MPTVEKQLIYLIIVKKQLTKIFCAFAIFYPLLILHTHALAGMAETVYRYEYSPGLYLNIGAPSDICSYQYGNQRCMWVQPSSYSSTSSTPYFRSPTFLSISDLTNGYIAGQSYNDKQWVIFNTKTNETEYTLNSESDIKSKVRELGGKDTLYDLKQVKQHFKKHAEPFDAVSFLTGLIVVLIIFGIPIYIIYKITKKLYDVVQKNTPIQTDTLPLTAPPSSVQEVSADVPPTPIQNVALLPLLPPTSGTKPLIQAVMVCFVLITFAYIGKTFWDPSFLASFSQDTTLKGKALYKLVENKEIIKDKKSLLLLNEVEGLVKDNLAVYRCDFSASKYQNCVIQEVVKHPETFTRITNIFGKDSELVYVVDEKTNNYKLLKEASAPTFRPLYNVMTESLMGLYAGDDFHLFKGEKILTIKSVPTGMNEALFYKEYKEDEPDAKERHPYSRMAKGFDGDIQYMADDEFMYHGDGKASSTDPFIHLTKIEGADRVTFTYYSQKMLGTAYLKYATDKNNIYCDNVTLGSDKYFTSDGLTVIKDPNPKSLQVIYPTGTITETNAGMQVAKTDTQVLVNCTPQINVDAKTFAYGSGGQKSFSDKNNTSLYLVPSNQTGVSSSSFAVLTPGLDRGRLSPEGIKDMEDSKKESEAGYFIHKDIKEGFSVELPSNFYVVEIPSDKTDIIFLARSKKDSQPYQVGLAISSENVTVSESQLLTKSARGLEEDSFKIQRDYIATNGKKQIRIIESSGVTTGSEKKINLVSALFSAHNKFYLVTSRVFSAGWEENKNIMTRIILSAVFE